MEAPGKVAVRATSEIWQWTCLPPMKMRKLLPFLCQTESFENHERCNFNTNFSLCFTASEFFFFHAHWYLYKSLWDLLASLVSFLFLEYFRCKFWSPGMVTWRNCRPEVFVKDSVLLLIIRIISRRLKVSYFDTCYFSRPLQAYLTGARWVTFPVISGRSCYKSGRHLEL